MKCADCKKYNYCDTEVFNYGYEQNKAEECELFEKKEFVDTMDNIISYLENERDRRINAMRSKMFCDDWTSMKHCVLINAALDAIEATRKQLKTYEKHCNYDKDKMMNPDKW